MRDSASRDRTSRRKATNFFIAGSILSLGFFDDVVEPKPETGSQLLADRSHFSNEEIRFHLRSPVIPVGVMPKAGPGCGGCQLFAPHLVPQLADPPGARDIGVIDGSSLGFCNCGALFSWLKLPSEAAL